MDAWYAPIYAGKTGKIRVITFLFPLPENEGTKSIYRTWNSWWSLRVWEHEEIPKEKWL